MEQRCLHKRHLMSHTPETFQTARVSQTHRLQVACHHCGEDLGVTQAIMAAIRSFPNGMAGGPDRLKPQNLKDMVQGVDILEHSPFLCALTEFCNLVFHGNVPVEVIEALLLWCNPGNSAQAVRWGAAHCCGMHTLSFDFKGGEYNG